MNIIQKQTELGKSLYQINTNAVGEFAELGRKNIEQYVEVAKSFGEKLPEVREVGSFLSLQREYGETLWNNAKESMSSQNAILQSALAETRDAFQTAYSPAVVEEAAPKAKKAKAAS